ncbi:MAG: hypothetical protein NTV06_03325 [candidate division Zixibacteria bacterium]|nr:hypothetical protein [candidate division Zixibacteria bacterium]
MSLKDKCFVLTVLYLILSCFLLQPKSVVATSTKAEATFRIDSYIPERFVDFQLRLNGALNLRGTQYDHKTYDSTGEYLSPPSSNSQDIQEIRGAIRTSYRYETIPKYWLLSLEATSNFNNHNSRGSYQSVRSLGFEEGISPSAEAGWYLTGDYFISGSIRGTWNYNSSESKGHDMAHSQNYAIEATLLPGWGRIYEGQTAATSLYIVDELRRKGILTREPSYQEMQELTALVYHYRNTHAIDARLHKIEALSKILDYLKRCEAMGDAGPYGYLLIQDIWDYFPTVSRRFGYRFRMGSGLIYECQSGQRESNGITAYYSYEHSTRQTTRPYLMAAAELAHPLGLRWQADLSTEWKYFVNPEESYRTFSIRYTPRGELITTTEFYSYNADQTFRFSGLCRYVIDSRSNAKITLLYSLNHYNSRIQYEQFHSGEVEFSQRSFDYFNSAFTAALELEYRISIPTTLMVQLHYSDTNNETGDCLRWESHYRSYQLRAEISHYLF